MIITFPLLKNNALLVIQKVLILLCRRMVELTMLTLCTRTENKIKRSKECSTLSITTRNGNEKQFGDKILHNIPTYLLRGVFNRISFIGEVIPFV